jgi:hypothetical protein
MGGFDAEGIGGLLFLLQIPATILSSIAIYRARNVHPIKGRFPRLVSYLSIHPPLYFISLSYVWLHKIGYFI